MKKRKKFVLAAAVLSGGLLATQSLSLEYRYLSIVVLGVASLVLSGWALWQDLTREQRVYALILPVAYPLSVALFYVLLPETLVSKVVLLVLFGLGMYALLLTENIFVVASARTIQLVRAAHAVGFLLTIITTVFLVGALFGLKFPVWVNGLATAAALFFVIFQGLWSSALGATKRLWVRAAVLAGIAGELSAVASIVPMTPLVAAILVSGYLYVTLGLFQQELQGRLFAKTIQEYLAIGTIVLAVAIFVTYRSF